MHIWRQTGGTVLWGLCGPLTVKGSTTGVGSGAMNAVEVTSGVGWLVFFESRAVWVSAGVEWLRRGRSDGGRSDDGRAPSRVTAILQRNRSS